jgi:hypothetical protein
MTGLTEMSITPAEPLSDRAAEFALKLNKFCTMSFTILYSSSNAYS